MFFLSEWKKKKDRKKKIEKRIEKIADISKKRMLTLKELNEFNKKSYEVV